MSTEVDALGEWTPEEKEDTEKPGLKSGSSRLIV